MSGSYLDAEDLISEGRHRFTCKCMDCLGLPKTEYQIAFEKVEEFEKECKALGKEINLFIELYKDWLTREGKWN
jgi:hypothetical protein